MGAPAVGARWAGVQASGGGVVVREAVRFVAIATLIAVCPLVALEVISGVDAANPVADPLSGVIFLALLLLTVIIAAPAAILALVVAGTARSWGWLALFLALTLAPGAYLLAVWRYGLSYLSSNLALFVASGILVALAVLPSALALIFLGRTRGAPPALSPDQRESSMRFMVVVQIAVPPERRADLPALRVAEEAHIAQQTQAGNLEAIYYEATDGPPTIWAVLKADSLEDAQRQVAGYPMYPFMRLTYTPLA